MSLLLAVVAVVHTKPAVVVARGACFVAPLLQSAPAFLIPWAMAAQRPLQAALAAIPVAILFSARLLR